MADEIPREFVEIVEQEIIKQTNEFIAKLNLTPEEGTFVRLQLDQLRQMKTRDEWLRWRDQYGPSFRTVALPAAFAITTKTYELVAQLLDGKLKLD